VSRYDDWTVIKPKPGETPSAVAGVLLALADDVHDVKTVLGGSAFMVPPYLAVAYLAPEPAPAPRKRRSTRKDDVE